MKCTDCSRKVSPVVVVDIDGTIQTFFSRIEEVEDCWLWIGPEMGGHSGTRYGQFKHQYVHRWTYERFLGYIPDGMSVLHKCDVKKCVHPCHLFLGTPLDNTLDMISKGRSGREKRQKITDQQVLEIRERRANGERSIDLALEYGIHRVTLGRIASGGMR